jgi:TonB family protein
MNQGTDVLARLVAAGLVVGSHVYALKLVAGCRNELVIANAAVQPGPTLVVAQLTSRKLDGYLEPVSEASLQNVPVEVTALTSVEFDSHDEDLTGIVGPASAPRPSVHQSVDTRPFGRCAGLQQGESATVLLIIEVRSNGRLGTVDVARSGGSAVIDAQAIRFARSLRWIPGTRNQEPQSMRISFPVTLLVQGSAELPRSSDRCAVSVGAYRWSTASHKEAEVS